MFRYAPTGIDGKEFLLPATLEVEEQLLAPESTTISSEFAAFVDHSVAGNDERDRILAVRMSSSALTGGRTHPACQFLIGNRSSIWECTKGIPHPDLKGRAWIHERHGELPPGSVEVFSQLGSHQLEDPV